MASLRASGGPVAYVEAWMRHAGWRVDHLFRFYVALFLADLMAEQGQTFNGNPIDAPAAARVRQAALFRDAATGV